MGYHLAERMPYLYIEMYRYNFSSDSTDVCLLSKLSSSLPSEEKDYLPLFLIIECSSFKVRNYSSGHSYTNNNVCGIVNF